MRIPVANQLRIKAFSGGSITELGSGITNGVVDVINGIPHITQRPSIDVFEDAGDQSAGTKGRGIFYWPDNATTYICNDDNLYKGTQATSISSGITSGTKRCYWFPIGGKVIFLNPQGDEAFSIDTSDTVTEITDTDFPPKQTPAVGLADGGAVLNNVLYVLGENGIIYSSDNADGETWGALDFIGASRDPDGGVYLAKHHDSLVALGFSTIEVFYDAANPVGSPLSRRQDVAYNIGCAFGEAVWEIGDRIFFIGVDAAGSFSVYVMEQFQLKKISTPDIDSFLTQAVVKDSYTMIGSGFSGGGHDFYLMTLATVPSSVSPEQTLCYDDTSGLWSIWSATVNDIVELPLVAWTKRYGSSSQYGQGILTNGDLISLDDNLSPVDTKFAYLYVAAGYVDDGYVQAASEEGTNIQFAVRTGMYDGGTNQHKIAESMRFVGNRTATSQTMTVTWSDERNDNYNSGRTMDTSINQKLHRLGRFQRRNHNLSMPFDEQFYLEAIELPLRAGND